MVDIKLVKKKQELFSWAAFLLLPHWPLQRIFNSYIFVGNNWQETIFFHFQMLEMTNETETEKSRWIEFDFFPSTRGREQLVARTRLQESNAKEAEPQVWIDSHLIKASSVYFLFYIDLLNPLFKLSKTDSVQWNSLYTSPTFVETIYHDILYKTNLNGLDWLYIGGLYALHYIDQHFFCLSSRRPSRSVSFENAPVFLWDVLPKYW